jgi:hypothetical protein
MRALGLPGVGAIAVPPHVLHLYRRGHEFLDISARFCCAGLECGECCVWVTAHPWTDDLAVGGLMKHLPNVEEYVASANCSSSRMTTGILATSGTSSRRASPPK